MKVEKANPIKTTSFDSLSFLIAILQEISYTTVIDFYAEFSRRTLPCNSPYITSLMNGPRPERPEKPRRKMGALCSSCQAI